MVNRTVVPIGDVAPLKSRRTGNWTTLDVIPMVLYVLLGWFAHKMSDRRASGGDERFLVVMVRVVISLELEVWFGGSGGVLRSDLIECSCSLVVEG